MNERKPQNPGRVLNVRYTLHERLGAGGQGEVWRARDPQRGSDIALKCCTRSRRVLRRRGRRCSASTPVNSRLDHPHVLKVFPPEATEEALLLPMELAGAATCAGCAARTISPSCRCCSKWHRHSSMRTGAG